MNNNEYYYKKLERYVAGGSSTGSKRARLIPEEPMVIERGKGCRVYDANGREFIDFRNSLGPVTLGYSHPEVNEAIIRQLEKGIVYGHPGVLEAEAAEKICGIIPCAEKVRFLKTGGEAVAACIKLARSYTGRKRIIQIGYNGWLNTLGSGARVNPRDRAEGVPKGIVEELSFLHHTVEWNDTSTIDELFELHQGEIAAIIVAADYKGMEDGAEFYPYLRKICNENETVLVFDEIVTGFRVALGGVSEYFNVTPDLAVFAKGMANGMPLSVFCGKNEIMDEITKGASVSSTYGGEQLSLAAALKVIEIYQREDVTGYLTNEGARLWNEVNKLFMSRGIGLSYKGLGPCPIIVSDNPRDINLIDDFFRKAFAIGISLYNVSYINYSHKKSDIEEVLEKLDNVISSM
ncbi:MAG: aminotransferase class III-fold pyridoxal phosphate-dependent enzyme [Clostridia bacterium]|nr:aminotransferase class III-fold pyridoxal phosphate-dependent enzyme [Clostridia bacterium]MBN2882838.1 aminotransferase class III-fold pyridoxal phosphate-dependent enzyme [Clostridia bacterium]